MILKQPNYYLRNTLRTAVAVSGSPSPFVALQTYVPASRRSMLSSISCCPDGNTLPLSPTLLQEIWVTRFWSGGYDVALQKNDALPLSLTVILRGKLMIEKAPSNKMKLLWVFSLTVKPVLLKKPAESACSFNELLASPFALSFHERDHFTQQLQHCGITYLRSDEIRNQLCVFKNKLMAYLFRKAFSNF